MHRAVLITLSVALAALVFSFCSASSSEASATAGPPSMGSWDRDTAVRVWRQRPFARVHQAQGEWMLVAAAWDRPTIRLEPQRDPSGLTLPGGIAHPLLAIHRDADRLLVKRLGTLQRETVVGTRMTVDSLLPDPMVLSDDGLMMSCRYIGSTLHHPEQLLCRRDGGQGRVNYECFTRASVVHDGACLFP